MDCASEPDGIAAGAGALPGARRRCEAGKRTHGPGPRACLALLAATALLALAAPAQAQTAVLISNFNQAVATGPNTPVVSTMQQMAQGFTTGSSPATLTSIDLKFYAQEATTELPSMTLHSGSPTGTQVAILTSSGSLAAAAIATFTFTAPATVTATPVSQPSCTIDELGDRRLLWQGQLTAGIREIPPTGNIVTGYGAGGEETGTLTPDAFTFRSTSYSLITWTSLDHLNVNLRDSDLSSWFPRDEVVDALRLHVCNTPYDYSDATEADLFSVHGDYRWNVGFNWPAGIERTLRLSLPPNHAATGDPVISGTVQVGEELTALTDGIMDDDVLDDVFTYQWVRVDADGTSNEEDITDETDATYTLTVDERGKKVKVEVRFVDILGGEETRTSAPTATLAGVPNTAPTGAPTITGTAQVGQTLTAVTTGIVDANGLTSPGYTYQWIRVNGTEADIAGENSSTYTLVDADRRRTNEKDDFRVRGRHHADGGIRPGAGRRLVGHFHTRRYQWIRVRLPKWRR